ncbi:hypothetical protein HI914_06010 [Erysiphe necator]|nr:hypothetical protein HI914_06010 [Erysiphe necator]
MAAFINASFYPQIGIRIIVSSQIPVTENTPVPVHVTMPIPIPMPIPISNPIQIPFPIPIPIPTPNPVSGPGPVLGPVLVTTESISHWQAVNTQLAPAEMLSSSDQDVAWQGILDVR